MTLPLSSAAQPAAEVYSPSFGNGHGPISPAFELKFLLDEAMVRRIETWSRSHLVADPHADAALDGAYIIHSLYLDTAGFDLFHQLGADHRHKYRLRRYGDKDILYLERKSRIGDRVNKQRVAETNALPPAEPANCDRPSAWFWHEVSIKRLRPVCRVTYRRTAFIGNDAGPVRLTLDRQTSCVPQTAWRVETAANGLPLLSGQVVFELKFRDALPALFKRLLLEVNLSPRAVSKYRCGVASWKLDAAATPEVR